ARMQIQHELPERPFEPRQSFLQYDEARTRQFRRQLEIHLAQRFAKLEMLLWLECIVAPPAERVMLDIPAGVGDVRYVVEGHVRNLRKLIFEVDGEPSLLFLQRRQRGF